MKPDDLDGQHTDKLDADLLLSISHLLDLDVEEVSTNSASTFVQLGGDSVKALELTFKLDAAGKVLDVETILDEDSTIRALSVTLARDSASRSDDRKSQSIGDSTETLPTRGSISSEHDTVASSHQQNLDSAASESAHQIGCLEDDIEGILPLTGQQNGLWLGSLKAPGTYLSDWSFRLPESIDVSRLQHAWQNVLQVVPILRTRIVCLSDDKLYQVILKYDYHQAQCSQRDDFRCQDIVTDYGLPLFAYGVEVCSNHKRFRLKLHHVLYDRWSMKLILQDVRYAYQHKEIPPLRPSYQSLLQSPDRARVDELKQIWRMFLGDRDTVSAPLLKQSKAFANASRCLKVLIRTSNSRNHTTKANLIAAAWSLVCLRHCNAVSVTFGLTVWGRDSPLSGIAEMAFPTFKTLPFRVQAVAKETTRVFLKRVRSNLDVLRKAQELDLAIISSIGESQRKACQFNSILVIQQDSVVSHEAQSSLLCSSDLLSFQLTQSNPLVLECIPEDDGIMFKMRYDSEYVSDFDAEMLFSHFSTAFKSLSTNVEGLVDHITLFGQRDQQLIAGWQRPSAPLWKTTLPALVQDQATRSLKSVAIWQTNMSLTYDQLSSYSRKVCSRVVDLNCDGHANVGVCFEKSAFAVVSMLGIALSGYTFVPMDAANPLNRLMQIIDDAEIELLICSRKMASAFENEDVQLLVIDEESLTTMPEFHDHQNTHAPTPEGNAYIIYTSGSTGRPKGVAMTHQALCTTLRPIAEHLEFSTSTRALQFSSFAFDMSVHDIWCTLMTGGTVCIPTETERYELDDFLERACCNYAMLTPSVALTLSEKSWRSFDKLSVSGEPLPKAVFLSALRAGVKFWNTYGPTETCVICLIHHVEAETTSPSRLGYSIAANAWIIDSNNPHRLSPVGCVGELVLTGHTLAGGYYRDEAKTEAAFVSGLEWTSMFPDYPLDKVYLTGDFAKYNSDGSIEFQGRIAGYTKIAGNRVDLGEIEYVLHDQCGLPKVSVQYCQVGGTNNRRDLLVSFCAYPSAERNERPALLSVTDEMKETVSKAFAKLRDLLPSFMIPSVFIPVSRYPYNTAGKLDKKRLTGLVAALDVDSVISNYSTEVQAVNSDTNFEQFSTETKGLQDSITLLRKCWATTLKLNASSLSIHSHFFKVGGDSLRAMNLGVSVRKSGYRLRVSDVFRHPVLNEMAQHLQESESNGADHPLGGTQDEKRDFWSPEEHNRLLAVACRSLQTQRAKIELLLPCSPLQVQMLAASEQSPGTYLHRECFEIALEITTDEIREVCQKLFLNNELLRSKVFIDEHSGQFVLAILQYDVTMEIVRMDKDLRGYLGRQEQTYRGVGTDLCQFVLLEVAGKRHLVWEMHHCIYDGYSEVLLLQQLRTIIERTRKDSNNTEQSEIKAAGRYKDFINFIHRKDKGEACKFWSEYLQDAPKLELGVAKHDSSSRVTNAMITRDLEVTWTSSEFTAATHIRAAFALVLCQYAQTSNVVFSVTNNGRDLPVVDIEHMTGPTFSTLPVRCQIDWQESISTLLSRTQTEAAAVASYQHLSIDEISRINAGCRRACHSDVHLLVQSAAHESPNLDLAALGYTLLPDQSPMSLQIPFNLVATATAKGLRLKVIYNNDVFVTGCVELMLDQFALTITSILRVGGQMQVDALWALAESSKKKLLSFQPSPDDQSRFTDLTIPQLVFCDSDKRADSMALYSSASAFTYRQLYEMSASFSRRIVESVPSSQRYIAVYCDKSPWAIIGQLAVLMAGHAYVSIDLSWPPARVQDILAQIDCPLIVTRKSLEDSIEYLEVTILVVDGQSDSDTKSYAEPSISRACANNAAYVIFTSGSTGVPKGVVIEHRTICKTISAYAERLNFTRETRALLFASFSFDASVMETWSVLAAGGTLCIADDTERISGLDGFINTSKVDCIGLTPTAALLVDPSRHEHIKTLVLCGEKCRTKDLERWTNRDMRLVNAYGPSEASVNAVMNTRFRDFKLNDIGRSMGGSLWVVSPDDHNRFVPFGAVGELLISGQVLAREYLSDVEKTKSKFVYPEWPSWTKMGGERAYKTGDLVRFDLDGRLLFIGRHDGQMKINGIRIEPDEIESIVHKCEANIQETVASTLSTEEGKHQVVLFFVPTDNPKVSTVILLALQNDHHQTMLQLDTFLNQRLPRSHIPSLYIPVSAIPQLPSGKADRKLLSQLASQLAQPQLDLFRPSKSNNLPSNTTIAPTNSQSHAIPRITVTDDRPLTETETTLISLWTQTLQQGHDATPVTRQSHFIESGGDSITAIRLSTLARGKDMDLPVSLIYANPTLSDMSHAVDVKKNREHRESVLKTPIPFEMIQDLVFSPFSPPGLPSSSLSLDRSDETPVGRSDYFGRGV